MLILLTTFSLILQNKVIGYSGIENLKINVNESDIFREIKLSSKAIKKLKEYEEQEKIPLYEAVTVLMIKNKYDISDVNQYPNGSELKKDFKYMYEKRPKEFKQLLDTYKSVFADIEYFPVAESDISTSKNVGYGDSWMAERLYGGKRGHEGCDIMAGINERDVYPIVSVSDGTVEKMGWLEKGGWRIGIRSKNGAYFYYAHLSRYVEDIKVGQKIKAGEIIGYMGDSGYGEEGTVGRFDVHLHFGIYIKTENNEELSVNPYWVLKCIEENRILYSY